MKRFSFFLLLVLSLLLLLPFSATAEVTMPLTLNQTYSYAGDGSDTVCFTFTADTTGIYTLFLDGNGDFLCTIADGIHDSWCGPTYAGDLEADWVLYAGTETTISLEPQNSQAYTVNVTVAPVEHAAAFPDSATHTVDYGASEALTIYHSPVEGWFTYRWVLRDYSDPDSVHETVIPGANQNVYVIPSVTENQDYACIVIGTDEAPLGEAEFHVHIRSNLTASIVGSETCYVSPLGSATLTVSAHADYGQISYQWYRFGYSDGWWTYLPLEGETGPVLTLENITDRENTYLCRIEDYDGTSHEELTFYVYVDNHLSVNAGNSSYTVSPGDSVTLSATASCDVGPLHYVWTTEDYSSSLYGEEVVLEGENGPSLTLNNIQTSREYYLRVTDDYGGYSSCWFSVTIPNGLTIRAQGPTQVFAARGESVTFSVRAQCADGSLSYRWYQEHDQIPGAGGSSCTVVYNPESEYMNFQYYTCQVVDQYQNRKECSFSIRTASDLNAWCISPEYLELEAGETAVLQVGTRSTGSGPLTYQWSREGRTDYEPQPIPGADGPSLAIEGRGGNASYYCTVEDSAGHTAGASFYVEVHSGLSVNYNLDNTAVLGQGVTLQVDAWSPYGPLTYQWCLGSEGYDPIEGATSASYATGPLTESQSYQCLVSDGYEVIVCNLDVQVINPAVTVSPAGSSHIQCQEGDEVTLSVLVSGLTGGEELGYEWCRSGMYMGNADGDSVTVRAGAGNTIYSCDVYVDGYPYTITFLVSASPMPVLHLAQPLTITFPSEKLVLLSFTPDSSGMYTFSLTPSTSVRCALFDSNWMGLISYTVGGFSQALSGGETYYLSCQGSSSISSGSVLVTGVSGSHTGSFTLIAGQHFVFPLRNYGETEILSSVSDAPDVCRTLGENIAAVSPGTAHVNVTYEDGYQLQYTVTVVSAGTQVLRVPSGTGALHAGAFEGDTGIQYVRLGQCLYVGSGAFRNTNVRQVVFDISSGSNPYIAPDAFAGSSPLIVGNGYIRDFAEAHGYEFLMIRQEYGGNG